MKNLKKPTRNQRKFILAADLDPNDWYVVKDTSAELYVAERHGSDAVRVLQKGDD